MEFVSNMNKIFSLSAMDCHENNVKIQKVPKISIIFCKCKQNFLYVLWDMKYDIYLWDSPFHLHNTTKIKPS